MTATDPEARETMRGQIESVLGQHVRVPSWRSGKHRDGWSIDHCGGCDWIAPKNPQAMNGADQFRAHLADVLLGLWDLGGGS